MIIGDTFREQTLEILQKIIYDLLHNWNKQKYDLGLIDFLSLSLR
jgi:hypothetical protein